MTPTLPGGGLVYLNNRYHDPTLGTFISVDPLVAVTGEAYIYASGNPTTLSDPSGLCATNDSAAAAACYADEWNRSDESLITVGGHESRAGGGPGTTYRNWAYNVNSQPPVENDGGLTLDDLQFDPREYIDGIAANADEWTRPGGGGCFGVTGGAGAMGDFQLCVVALGDEIVLVSAGGVGVEAGLEATVAGGALITNAQNAEQLSGFAVCGSASVAVGGGGTATVCGGVTNAGTPTGFFTVSGQAALGAAAGTGVFISRTEVILRDYGLTYSRLGDVFDALEPSGSAPPIGVCSGGSFSRTNADAMGMHQISTC